LIPTLDTLIYYLITTSPSASLMEAAEDINCAFVLACRNNDVESAQTLLSQGADINFRFPIDDLTALHCAVKKGQLEAVKFLLEQGALDLNAVSKKRKQTALHIACQKNYTEIALMLIKDPRSLRDSREKVCLLDSYDSRNRLALHSACLNKNVAVVKALLEYPIYWDFEFEMDDLLALCKGNKAIRNEIFKYVMEE
jgi:ankyrin repeat protein